MEKILEVKNLKVHFRVNKGIFTKAKTAYSVDGVSFDVYAGETLGIVGESGCGKSTLARALVGLNEITAGEIVFLGKTHLESATKSQLRKLHHDVQFIFQDSIAALNPRMTVLEIISEPLISYHPKLSKQTVYDMVLNIMEAVGLTKNQIYRYPSEFSGGQCQRIAIARALILNPKLIICDESVSALDASIKSQIINLLQDLQAKLNLTIIFISHDLGVVRHICDRVLVMYLGNIMELASKDEIFKNPLHPYSNALLKAVPIPDPKIEKQKPKVVLDGELPSVYNPPKGCVFSSRCPYADEVCKKSRPPLEKKSNGMLVACFKAK